RDVNMLLGRGRDLLGLVNNLLELHRLESGDVHARPSPTQLTQLLDDCVAAAGYLVAERSLTLLTQYDQVPARALVDAVLLRRIVTNLLSNAMKFTDQGSVTLAAHQRGGELVLSIRDTGVGIASEDLPKLFHKFVQLEAAKTKRHAGTGLGLVIVKD